jgi:hypothetical protein
MQEACGAGQGGYRTESGLSRIRASLGCEGPGAGDRKRLWPPLDIHERPRPSAINRSCARVTLRVTFADRIEI